MVKQKEIDRYIEIARKDLNESRFESSLKGLRKVLELDPENLEVHYLIGIAYLKNDNYRQAISHLENVIHSEFSYLHVQHANMLLGYAHNHLEDYEAAIASFDNVLAINFNNDGALAAQAHVLFKMGQNDKALDNLEKALSINPDNLNARNSLAYILGETDQDLERAMQEAIHVTRQEPGNYVYQDTLGWIYHKKGKEELARETLQRALEMSPDNEEIKDHLRTVLGMT